MIACDSYELGVGRPADTMTTNSTAEVTSKLLSMLPNNKVNKEHPLTTAKSQAKHKGTDITKISKRKLIPANAFWVICLTGDCGKLDLSKRDCYAQRYCAWFASHTPSKHKGTKILEFFIYSVFECENNGYSWGKEYLQVEQLNTHSYKYWDGDLIEVEIENKNEDDNDNNDSIMDNNNINQEPNSSIALQVVTTVVNKIIPKLKSSQRQSNIVGYLNNSNNSDMNNNNSYNNSNNNNNFDCDLNENLSASGIFNEVDNAALGMFVFDVFVFLFFRAVLTNCAALRCNAIYLLSGVQNKIETSLNYPCVKASTLCSDLNKDLIMILNLIKKQEMKQKKEKNGKKQMKKVIYNLKKCQKQHNTK